MKSPLEIAIWLMKYASITPDDKGCLTDLAAMLSEHGFATQMIHLHDTKNLYARYGSGKPFICFAGHVDVVPPSDINAWTNPPFEPTISDGRLYGRGAEDMKGAVAAFISAAFEAIENGTDTSIGILLTSDEEGSGANGIKKIIDEGLINDVPDVYIVGEPAGDFLGDSIQTGRRGGLTATLTCHGTEGHVAYPHLIDNPILRIVDTIKALTENPLDDGMPPFEKSLVQMTSVDVGNPVENISPARASCKFSIRFNALHTCESIDAHVRSVCDRYAGDHELDIRYSREAYLTTNEKWIGIVSDAIRHVTGHKPRQSAEGGCTDGSFLSTVAPVIEIGLPSRTLHKVDENIYIEDLEILKKIYLHILL